MDLLPAWKRVQQVCTQMSELQKAQANCTIVRLLWKFPMEYTILTMLIPDSILLQVEK